MAEVFNRNRFQGGTINSIKEEEKRAEAAIPQSGNYSGRAGFFNIEDGKNVFRIAPSHNTNEPAYRAKSTVILECEVSEIDNDGKETGKKEMKRKNIFIATQHSTTLQSDPILLYIEFVNKRATDEIQDKDERSKFLSPITGWRGKDKKWNWGIKPSVTYVCYVWNSKGELGRLELYPSILDDMKKVSVAQADDDAEIIPDIFTAPDEGYPLIIIKEKNDKDKMEYNVSCELPTKKESWDDFFKRTQLNDDQLIEFLTKETLAELYKDVYTTRDFSLALDGLQRFDKQYKFEIFENEEFLEKLTELKKLVPEYKSRDEKEVGEMIKEKPAETKSNKPAPASNTNVPAPTNNASPVSSTPVPAMKRIIKEYIAENYGADYSLPELSKEDLIVWYDLVQQGEELPFDLDQSEEKLEEQATQKVEKAYQDIAAKEVKKEEVKPEPKSVVNVPENDELAAQIAALRKRRG